MKKLLITLLFFTFYCNGSFASDFPLARLATKNYDPNLSYKKLAFLEKSKLSCKIERVGTKENNFIEVSVCDREDSSIGCIVYIDKKPNPAPKETYCFNSLDLALIN